MTNQMNRRNALALSLGFAVAACAKTKPKIYGNQIPVLPVQNGMDVAVDAPAVTVPDASLLTAWPQPLGNAAHAVGNVSGPAEMAAKWRARIGEKGGYRQPLAASPVAAGGSVFTMDANGAVASFSASDGSQAWRRVTRPKQATQQNIGGGIAYDGGKIYASTGYGELLALDAASGHVLWRQALDFPAKTAPMLGGGLVALVVQNDLLLTFDAISGTPGWRFTGQVGTANGTAVAITGAPAFADGIVVAGFSSGTLAALDANSGTPLWEQSFEASFGQASALDFTDIVAAPVIANEVVYAIGLGNTAMAIDLHSGAKVWTHSATGTQPFCIAGDFAYVLDQGQKLYAVHADDGLVCWATQLPMFKNMKKKKGAAVLWSGPLMVNGALLLTNNLGQLGAVDALDGSLQAVSRLAGPADMAPVVVNGVLLQLTRDATLTAYA